VVLGALGALAVWLLPSWFPVAAAVQAQRQDTLYFWLMVMSSFIFSLVIVFLVYMMVKFRAKPGDDSDGAPIHGHTGLEITWTIIPFILVTAIAIVSAIVLSRNDAQAQNTLRVNVTAQQFEFTFSYPDAGNVTSPVLMLPKDRSVELYMRALDVIHSVFVPEFSVKEDIVPGLVTQLHVTPTRLGTFPLECTELCGLGHSLMRSQAVVMEPAAFNSWLKKQEKSAAPTTSTSTSSTTSSTTPIAPAQAGLMVFNQNGCAACHTLSAANATGKVGPDLDNLVSYARTAKQPLESFVHQSIVDPEAYIQPGYPKGVMPPNFGQVLTKEQLDHLVTFLVQSAQKSGNK
jgi:cytochrome c oxidase subunit 2